MLVCALNVTFLCLNEYYTLSKMNSYLARHEHCLVILSDP